MHYTYVLQSLSDHGLYIGYSSHLRRRMAEHHGGAAISFRLFGIKLGTVTTRRRCFVFGYRTRNASIKRDDRTTETRSNAKRASHPQG